MELAALYYYAAQKQDNRVEAELRRLKAKYPGFVAPTTSMPIPPVRAVSEETLWALYEKERFCRHRTGKPAASKETPAGARVRTLPASSSVASSAPHRQGARDEGLGARGGPRRKARSGDRGG